MHLEIAQEHKKLTPLLQSAPNLETVSGELLPTFDELYEQYFPRLYSYLSYRVDSTQDAEDLVAETFIKVVKGLPTFKAQHQHSFAAWLFRIAHNTLVSFQRDKQHWQTVAATLPLEVAEDLPAPQNQLPEEQLLKQEQIRLVRHMLESLAPRQQEVLKLKFFGELRNREIAAILDLDERSVSAYLHRGLEELQRRYLPAQSATANSNQSTALPKRGHKNNLPSNFSSLPFVIKRATILPSASSAFSAKVQPQSWLAEISASNGGGSSNGPTTFALAWFNAYLQEATSPADDAFRLGLKAYLLTQLPIR